jgi:hypothetical protein
MPHAPVQDEDLVSSPLFLAKIHAVFFPILLLLPFSFYDDMKLLMSQRKVISEIVSLVIRKRLAYRKRS